MVAEAVVVLLLLFILSSVVLLSLSKAMMVKVRVGREQISSGGVVAEEMVHPVEAHNRRMVVPLGPMINPAARRVMRIATVSGERDWICCCCWLV